MRIGLIIYGSLKILTGGYIYDDILVRHLRRRGHGVTVFSRTQRPYWRHLGDNCFDRLVRLAADPPPDLLLQDGLCHPSLFGINRRLKQQSGVPIVALVHQVLSRRRGRSAGAALVRWVEKSYLKSVDAVITNSCSTRRAVQALVGRPKPALVATPGGDRLGRATSEEWISRRARAKGPLRLVFLANVLPHKGLHRVFEALSGLSKPIWQLTVVGDLSMDRPYADDIKAAVAARGLANRVFFSGAQNGAELAKILNHSHVLVLPYSHEAFGIAYVEAMAFGLPAVASTAGAAKETIRHGCNGFLVEPRDKHAWIDWIRLLCENRDRLARMSLTAYASFRKRPTWAASTAAVEAFLLRLVGTGSG